MMTTTHMLIAAAASTRPKMVWWMIALGWFGGFLPDAPMFIMVGLARLTGIGGNNLWREPDGLYWQEPWQSILGMSHSFPVWIAVLAVGFLLWRMTTGRWKTVGQALLVFGVGGFLHALVDFPVHTDDAHMQLWPFSNWRFHSSVSYYQRDHYGRIVSTLEMVAGIALAIFLWRRFKNWAVRTAAVLMCLPYIIGIRFLF